MQRREGGLAVLSLALLASMAPTAGCGLEPATIGSPLGHRGGVDSARDPSPTSGALSATRLGLAAWTRMLRDEALRDAGPLGLDDPYARVLLLRSKNRRFGDTGRLGALWENLVEAHQRASYSDEQLSFAAHAGATAVWLRAGSLPEEERITAVAGVERVRARVVADAVERRYAQLTTHPEMRAALKSAGDRLDRRIGAATAAGGDEVEDRVMRAWERYAAEASGLLEAAVAARGPSATRALERVMEWISWEAESASLSARDDEGAPIASHVDSIVRGLGAFYASVRSPAAAAALDDAGLRPAEADAALAILANLYATAV